MNSNEDLLTPAVFCVCDPPRLQGDQTTRESRLVLLRTGILEKPRTHSGDKIKWLEQDIGDRRHQHMAQVAAP